MPTLLYCDENALVAVKPVGMLSETGAGAEDSFSAALSAELFARGENSRIFPVHRLDQAVGGVMIFARNEKTAALLAKEGALVKSYLAVVRGKPEPSARLTDFLFKDARRNKTFVVDRKRKGVREAALSYRLLAYDEKENLSLLFIRLETGRSHQIRAQFSARKHPLVGDGKYGGGDNRAKSPALFSARLRVESLQREFSALPENAFPWSLFSAVWEEGFPPERNNLENS